MANKANYIAIDKAFGDRLCKLRQQIGLSQAQLAKELGYKTGASISTIEAGKSPIDVNKLYRLAKILKADLHTLITGEPSPTVVRFAKAFRPQIEAHFKALQEERSELNRQLVGLDLASKFQGEDNQAKMSQVEKRITEIDSEYEYLGKTIAEVLGRKSTGDKAG